MKVILLGAAGFIGTNLIIQIAKNQNNVITVVDRNKSYFEVLKTLSIPNLRILESEMSVGTDFERLVEGQDVVYHLISTTVPTTSNKTIPDELTANVLMSSYLLEACVRKEVKKVVFLSSGGTVYGKEAKCPLNEDTPTNPMGFKRSPLKNCCTYTIICMGWIIGLLDFRILMGLIKGKTVYWEQLQHLRIRH